MNILFLTSTLPRFEGDQQAPFVLEQAAAWTQARPDDTVTILAPHDANARDHEIIDRIDIHRFRYMRPARLQTLAYPAILPNIRQKKLRALQIPFFLIAQFLAARRLIKTKRIDLVYAHWVMPQGLVALALNKVLGVPYALQNHSSDLAVFGKFGRLGRRCARSVLANARVFFCVNQMQAGVARGFAPGLMCHVLPMGLSLDLDRARGSSDVAEATYALGTISRLSAKKGLGHLIAAVKKIQSDGVQLPVAIAGDGEDRAALAEAAEGAEVAFRGFLTDDAKVAFFAECYAMVFCSVASNGDVEGLPVALLEALAAGKQVIVSEDTNITQLPEWPQIAEAVAFLSDPTDTDAFAAAIREVLALTPADAERRAQTLRHVIGRYRWDALIHNYLAAIDDSGVKTRG